MHDSVYFAKCTHSVHHGNRGDGTNGGLFFLGKTIQCVNSLILLNGSIYLPSNHTVVPWLSLRPSCPALFLPHPNTAPDRERAKLWSPPAVIFARGIPARDLRGWGNSLLGSPFPSPSWPLVFWPHVNSCPSKWKRTAQLIHMSSENDGYTRTNKNKLMKSFVPLESAMQCWFPHITWAIRWSHSRLINLCWGNTNIFYLISQKTRWKILKLNT